MQGAGGLAWGGITCVLPYQLYLRTGDLSIVLDTYNTTQGYLNYWLNQSTPGVILTTGGLGDWQSPHGGGSTDEVTQFVNSYFVYVLKIGAKLASLAGDDTQAEIWSQAAVNRGNLVHKTYYNTTTQKYGQGKVSHQGDQLAPLMAGLVPDELRSGVVEKLLEQILVESGGHVDTGLFNTFFLADLLASEHDDVLYTAAAAPTAPS